MSENKQNSIQTKNAFFFSHDSNARNDEKIIRLRMKYGVEGYGIYFMLIEMLLEATDYVLRLDYDALAFNLRAEPSTIQSVVENFDLFDFTDENESFYSHSLNKRMKPLEATRKQRSQAGAKSAEARKRRKTEESRVEDEYPTTVGENPTGIDKTANDRCQNFNREEESIVEKNRAKENRVEQSTFVAPTPQEVEEYCKERSNSIDCQKFVDFYQSKGWMVGRNKMKDWKACVRSWERDNKPLPRRDRAPNIANHKNDTAYEQF